MRSCQERSLKYDQYEEIYQGAGNKHVPWELIYLTGLPQTKDQVRQEPNIALRLLQATFFFLFQ